MRSLVASSAPPDSATPSGRVSYLLAGLAGLVCTPTFARFWSGGHRSAVLHAGSRCVSDAPGLRADRDAVLLLGLGCGE